MSDVTVKYAGGTIGELNASGKAVLKANRKKLKTDILVEYSKAPWTYLGDGATKISNFADFSIALKDTDFNTWLPSSTAAAILATDTFGTFVADMKNYDYVIRWTFWTDLKYNAGATLKVMPYKQRSIALFNSYRRPRYYTDFQAENFNYNTMSSVDNVAAMLYYNSNGNIAGNNVTNYGFYATAGVPTFSGATSNTPTVTIPRPVLYARCRSTYMATERAAEIDKTNSKLYLRCEVFRVNKDYTKQAEWREMVSAMNDA